MREYYLKFFLMISHLNSHRTTDIKPEMLSGVQTGNGTPHDKYNILSITHERTNRKDDIFMQRQLVQNLTFILDGARDLFIDEAHIAPGIFPVFLPCMLPTPLCGIFPPPFFLYSVFFSPSRPFLITSFLLKLFHQKLF